MRFVLGVLWHALVLNNLRAFATTNCLHLHCTIERPLIMPERHLGLGEWP
jgi:hypothetical protein